MIRFLKPYEWKVEVNPHLIEDPVRTFTPGVEDDSLPMPVQSRLVTRGIATWVKPKPERAVAEPAPESRRRTRRAVSD